MFMNEIVSKVMEIPGATMVRVNKTNFIAVPTESGYAKINVLTAADKDTKNHKAFNFEAAAAEYKAWEAAAALREAERASKPKTASGPNPEAQARRDELDAKIMALPSFTDYTATDLHTALVGQVPEKTTIMAVGAAAHRLVDKGSLVMTTDEKRKPHYTKA